MEMWAEDKNGDLVPTTDPDSAVVTNESLGEDSQRQMCPKHGIAHGVCVDPIKAESAPGEHQNWEEDGGTWWWTRNIGGLERPATELNPSPPSPRSTPPTNRFDPYEALDKIQGFICNFGANSAAQEIAEGQLYALRAYITGMER